MDKEICIVVTNGKYFVSKYKGGLTTNIKDARKFTSKLFADEEVEMVNLQKYSPLFEIKSLEKEEEFLVSC